MSDVVVPNLVIQGALSFAFVGLWIASQFLLGGRLGDRSQRVLQTCAFAMTGMVTLVIGNQVATGVMLDLRGMVIGLATAYSGPFGGAVTAAVCAATRWQFGGLGAPAGVIGIAADYLAALAVMLVAWRRLPSRWPVIRLATLGAAVGATEALSLALIPSAGDAVGFFGVFGAGLFATQFVGILVPGILIELAEERKALLGALQNRVVELDAVLRQTVDAFSKAMVHSDPYTAGHESRVADLCLALGRRMGLDADRLRGLEIAAEAHDVGQIKVPAEILLRPRALTALEFAFIRQHPDVGWDILQTIDFPWPVADIVRQHHENYDGSGYPQGLRGEQILLEARILRVADTAEALCSHRPFRPALSIADASAQLRTLRGTALDPQVVDHCLALIEEGQYRFPTAPAGSPAPYA